jgi:hypothetical protein
LESSEGGGRTEIEDHRAAPYGNTDELETEAVDILKNLLNHKYIKSDLRERDKMPNIDGYLELVDESRVPQGKLEVQIKRMPKGNIVRPRQLFPISLIDYAENSTNNPVIFISVDCINEVAYWHEVSNSCLSAYSEQIANNIDQFILHFPPHNVIEPKSSKYIQAWQEIFRKRNAKFRDYDILRKQNNELRERSDPLLGEMRPEFENLHSFIDATNQLIESKFSLIKRNLFNNCWKLGISYSNYSDKQITFGLYPIPTGKNDLQIKQLPKDLRSRPIPEEIRTIHSFYSNNPLHTQPNQHAEVVVQGYVKNILDYRLLTHTGSDFLAREYLFALIDKFPIPLGIEEKERYRVDEISHAFFVHLPFWLDEASQYILRNPSKFSLRMIFRHEYLDPELIDPYIDGEVRAAIEENIQRRIEDGEKIPHVYMGNEKIRFGLVNELVNYVSLDPSREITRVYPKRIFERASKGSGWIWDTYTKEEFGAAIRTFFENFPSVYNFILAQNFYEIAEDISILHGVSKIVIFYNFSENWSLGKSPSYEFFYLKGDESPEIPEVNVLPGEAREMYSNLSFSKAITENITVDEMQYRVGPCGWSVCNFLFNDTPMMNFVYDSLGDDIKRYFKRNSHASVEAIPCREPR